MATKPHINRSMLLTFDRLQQLSFTFWETRVWGRWNVYIANWRLFQIVHIYMHKAAKGLTYHAMMTTFVSNYAWPSVPFLFRAQMPCTAQIQSQVLHSFSVRSHKSSTCYMKFFSPDQITLPTEQKSDEHKSDKLQLHHFTQIESNVWVKDHIPNKLLNIQFFQGNTVHITKTSLRFWWN